MYYEYFAHTLYILIFVTAALAVYRSFTYSLGDIFFCLITRTYLRTAPTPYLLFATHTLAKSKEKLYTYHYTPSAMGVFYASAYLNTRKRVE